MAKLTKIQTQVEAKAQLVLTEAEIRAIDGLTGYGIDAFLAVFYKHLGEHYLKPHEEGLRSFFESVRGIRSICIDAEECREFLLDRARKLQYDSDKT